MQLIIVVVIVVNDYIFLLNCSFSFGRHLNVKAIVVSHNAATSIGELEVVA